MNRSVQLEKHKLFQATTIENKKKTGGKKRAYIAGRVQDSVQSRPKTRLRKIERKR